MRILSTREHYVLCWETLHSCEHPLLSIILNKLQFGAQWFQWIYRQWLRWVPKGNEASKWPKKLNSNTYMTIFRTFWVDARPRIIFRFSASLSTCWYKPSKTAQSSSDWAATLNTTCCRSPGILQKHRKKYLYFTGPHTHTFFVYSNQTALNTLTLMLQLWASVWNTKYIKISSKMKYSWCAVRTGRSHWIRCTVWKELLPAGCTLVHLVHRLSATGLSAAPVLTPAPRPLLSKFDHPSKNQNASE